MHDVEFEIENVPRDTRQNHERSQSKQRAWRPALLVGTGILALLYVKSGMPPVADPQLLAFGQLAAGGSRTLPLRLTNVSGRAQSFDGFAVRGIAAKEFVILDPKACRVILEPDAFCDLQIQFTPADAGARYATLIAQARFPGEATQVPLTRVGMESVAFLRVRLSGNDGSQPVAVSLPPSPGANPGGNPGSEGARLADAPPPVENIVTPNPVTDPVAGPVADLIAKRPNAGATQPMPEATSAGARGSPRNAPTPSAHRAGDRAALPASAPVSAHRLEGPPRVAPPANKTKGDGPNEVAQGLKPPRIVVTSDLQQAKLKQPSVKPVYPRAAVAAGVEGTVRLIAVVGTDGRIKNLKLVSGPVDLARSAMEAVQQWTYQPTRLNGQPVEVGTTIDVNFKLQR